MVRKRGKSKGFHMKPFCYYCDRAFDEESTLVQHQKAKHFKCEVCHKKLTTARALRTHSVQVHKLDLKTVPHAKSERSCIDPDIIGMSGIPDFIIEAKTEGMDLSNAIKLQKKNQIKSETHSHDHLTNQTRTNSKYDEMCTYPIQQLTTPFVRFEGLNFNSIPSGQTYPQEQSLSTSLNTRSVGPEYELLQNYRATPNTYPNMNSLCGPKFQVPNYRNIQFDTSTSNTQSCRRGPVISSGPVYTSPSPGLINRTMK
jgi:hypothetical protein